MLVWRKKEPMAGAYWEHYEHTADIGIRGVGHTLAEAFAQAAMALTATITDPQSIKPIRKIEFTSNAEDTELLFVDWLNKLIYEMAVNNMLFGRFELDIQNQMLKAKVWGETIDIARHQPAVEVKAATYSDLKVEQDVDGNWMAQCIIDV